MSQSNGMECQNQMEESDGRGFLDYGNLASISEWTLAGTTMDYTSFYKNDKLKLVYAQILSTPNAQSKSWTLPSTVPKPANSVVRYPVVGMTGDGGTYQGYGVVTISSAGAVNFNATAGCTYIFGTIIYRY